MSENTYSLNVTKSVAFLYTEYIKYCLSSCVLIYNYKLTIQIFYYIFPKISFQEEKKSYV